MWCWSCLASALLSQFGDEFWVIYWQVDSFWRLGCKTSFLSIGKTRAYNFPHCWKDTMLKRIVDDPGKKVLKIIWSRRSRILPPPPPLPFHQALAKIVSRLVWDGSFKIHLKEKKKQKKNTNYPQFENWEGLMKVRVNKLISDKLGPPVWSQDLTFKKTCKHLSWSANIYRERHLGNVTKRLENARSRGHR